MESPESRPFESKWENRASFERAEMVRQGLLVGSADGIWTLTPEGKQAFDNLGPANAIEVRSEFSRRETMWQGVLKAGGPVDIPAQTLRDLGIYAGARGIYVNQERTRSNFSPRGIAVSFLHTGKSYADELSESGVIYHYPRTKRIGHDEAEIEASKAAYRAGLPVFVIGPGRGGKRTVYRGYVEDFDDSLAVLLITFTEGRLPPPPPIQEDNLPFSLMDEEAEKIYRMRQSRPNQSRFAMKVFQRYGTSCAVCGLDVPGLVQAAHLKPKRDLGSDEARNGLPLCANHHLAFDNYLWAVDPASLRIQARSEGPNLCDLGIRRADLSQLGSKPHPDALQDAWARWKRSQETA